jgi:hypothetical protein
MPERLVASRALPEQFWQEKNARMAKAKNPNAVALGRRGGLKGGKARTANLTDTKRRELGAPGGSGAVGEEERLGLR